MRIGVMAAGAVGGYFGGRLAAAGHDVTFFARGAHLEAIRRDGLKIESPLGDLHLKDVQATDDPARVAPVDIVLFAVKLWDLEKAAEQCARLVGRDPRHHACRTGSTRWSALEPILGDDNVVGGYAQVATVIGSPGVIVHTSKFAHAPLRPRRSPCRSAARGLRRGRAEGRARRCARREHRTSSCGTSSCSSSSLAGATGATRLPVGPILADPDTRALVPDLMREVVAVGRAKGVALPADHADKALAFAERPCRPA